MSEEVEENTVIEFCCANCGGNNWKLYLHQCGRSTGLILRCGDQECVQQMLKEVGAAPEVDGEMHIIWKEFNITDDVSDDVVMIPGPMGFDSSGEAN